MINDYEEGILLRIDRIVLAVTHSLKKMPPTVLAENLVTLTSLRVNMGDILIDKEIDYIKKWNSIRTDLTLTDKQVENKAKVEPEYRDMRKFEVKLSTINQLNQSIKKLLREYEEQRAG